MSCAVVDVTPEPRQSSGEPECSEGCKKRLSCLRLLLGVSAGRSLWGLEPFDFRPSRVRKPNKVKRASCVESLEARKRKHSTSSSNARWYQGPLRRHDLSDGDAQYELHPAWGELFLDLIFVGAAYRLGKVVKYGFCDTSPDPADEFRRKLAPSSSSYDDEPCSGPTLGILYASALFLCCLRLWLCDLHFRGRFECPSNLHKFQDVLSYLLLVWAGQNIYPVDTYTDNKQRLYGFIGFMVLGQGLWLLRWLEVALFSHDTESRRFSALRLVDDMPAILWWIGAALVAEYNGADNVAVPILLIVGAYWSDLRTAYRVQRAAWLRICDPDGELDNLPKLRTRVPINVEFAIHRFNEFMMLMIGEGMLQLVIAMPKEEFNDVFDDGWNIATVAGFLLSLCMCYSFNVTEPHHAKGHAFARASRPAAMYQLLLPPKALSILFTGIGIKMVLYKPDKPLIYTLHVEQQLQLSLSLCSCFALQLIRQPLHDEDGIIAFYSPSRLRAHPKLALTIFLRLILIGAMIGVSFYKKFQMWQFVVVQACLAILFCACHIGETKVDPNRKRHTRAHSIGAKIKNMMRTSLNRSRRSLEGGAQAAPAAAAGGGVGGTAAGGGAAPVVEPSSSKAPKRRNRNKASCMIRGDAAQHVRQHVAPGHVALQVHAASSSAGPAAKAAPAPAPVKPVAVMKAISAITEE